MSDCMIVDNAPLYKKLKEHISNNPVSFHTPGHKSNATSPICDIASDFLKYDLTEIEGLDSLFEAQGVIDEAEQKAAEYFECEKTCFSAGGCTLAIQAMIMLATNKEKGRRRILATRNIHRGAVNACALLDVDVDWICPAIDENGFLGTVNPMEVEIALSENMDNQYDAVYITSPNYYGILEDIGSISSVCHSYGIPLVVDNAHGTHLKAFEHLHPIDRGADITCCSAHKTWPVFTGGAFLNINNKKFVDGAKEAMGLFGSTSPSYPIMASLDVAREWMRQNGKQYFGKTAEYVENAKRRLSDAGYRLPFGECDPTRIAVNAANMSMNARQIEMLLVKNNIYPEFVTDENLVFIVTPFNNVSDIDKLVEVLISVKCGIENMARNDTGIAFVTPKREMSIREAMLGNTRYENVNHIKGKIAASTFCPCPPGVPVVMPGEVITSKVVSRLKKEKIEKFKIVSD